MRLKKGERRTQRERYVARNRFPIALIQLVSFEKVLLKTRDPEVFLEIRRQCCARSSCYANFASLESASRALRSTRLALMKFLIDSPAGEAGLSISQLIALTVRLYTRQGTFAECYSPRLFRTRDSVILRRRSIFTSGTRLAVSVTL